MSDATQDRLSKAAIVIRSLKEKVATLEQEAAGRDEPVAIVGAGCRLPGGAEGLDGYWSLLDEGRDGIAALDDRWALVGEQARDDVPRWAGLLAGDVAGFDAAFFGISPREAVALDPQQRLLLEVGWEALQDAGLVPHRLAGTRTGVFIGACVSDYAGLVAKHLGDAQDAYGVTGNLLSIAAGRLAYTWGLQGPCLTVDTACSSSLVAVHLACRSLRAGESELALAGGVNLLFSPSMMGALGRTQALAPDGRCKTFDARANGFARGEGCGIVVLERLRDARANGHRVYAVIRGSAVNQDGRSTGLTAPNVRSQEALLRTALQDARVAPDEVDFIETHGTGTSLGDPIEVEALRTVFGAARPDGTCCRLGAVKTNFGHLEAAAGIAGLLKVVLALDRGRIPKNLNFETENPRLRLAGTALALAAEPSAWPRGERPRRAGVSAFGISGTNAHVVLEEAPADERPATPARSAELVVMSAKSEAALGALAGQLADQLAAAPQPSMASVVDLAHALATTRSAWPHRLAVTAASTAELATALAEAADGRLPPGGARGRAGVERPRIVFVFPGQGGQWLGMGRQLLAEEPVFEAAMAACDRAIEREAGWSLLAALYGDAAASTFERIDRIQPALFAIEVALAALWRAWGVEPDAVIGHSMGEVAAAHVAGALGLDDAVAVICRRSRLLRTISGRGEMALVELPLAAAAEAIAGHADRLSVAVSNSPRSTVLSGDPGALATVLTTLEAAGVFCRRVKVDVASHSPQVDPLRPAIEGELASLRPQRSTVPMRSTVTGATLDGPELDAGYWVANLREPVRFAAAVQALLAEGPTLLLELGPHPVLTPAVEEILLDAGVAGAALVSLRRDQPERAVILESLGALWVHGLEPQWRGVFPHGGRPARLPTHPWQHERFWIPVSAGVARGRFEPGGTHPLLGVAQSLSTQPGTRLWEQALDPRRIPWLEDHRIRGVALFPGAGYLELMLGVGAQIYGDVPLVVEGARFVEALVLAGDAATVQVVTTEAGPGCVRVQIASQAPGSDAWIVHATATLRPAVPAEAAPSLARATISPRLGPVVTAQALYAALARQGFDYGPAFQGLLALQGGKGEALGRIALPAAAGDDGAYRLHPALLDACLHVLAGAAHDDDAWMPVEVGALRLFARPSGPLWCHARLTASASERRTADFVLADEHGAAIAEVRGLVTQRLPGGVGRREDDAWYLESIWERASPPRRHTRAGRFAIVAGDDETGRALQAALEAAGQAAALAPLGPHEPAATAPLAPWLRSAFDGRGPTAVVDLRSLDPHATLDVHASRAVEVIAATASLGEAQPPRLWLVTRGVQPVEAGGVAVEPSPVLGLARTAALELPELRVTCIDLDPARPALEPTPELAALVAELLGDADEQELAFRGGTRRVARLVRRPPHAPVDAIAIRSDRSYLVTGGLGGLGRSVAGWLASRGAGHLVLVGRSGAAAAESRAAVAAIAAMGTRVTVVRADVSVRAELARLLDDLDAAGPPLAGVVHTAGVLADALLLQQDPERLRAVLGAKAHGALHLDALTRARPLDFFVLYASGAGVLGSPGQGNYAAANAVLDALAHRRRAQGLPATSIDWGLFAGVGLAAAADERGARLVSRGARSLSEAEGLQVLERLLGSDRPQHTVVPLDVRAWAELVPVVTQLPRFSRLLDAAAAAHEPTTEESFAELFAQAAPDERLPLTVRRLRRHVARVLRLPEARLDDDTPLIGLGLDSLMGLELKHRLRRDTAVDVPMTQLLRDMTVARLARLVIDQRPRATPPAVAPQTQEWTDIEL